MLHRVRQYRQCRKRATNYPAIFHPGLDGQSKFFRREAVWECVDPVVEVVFLGYEPTTTYMLFDGDLTGNARAFAFINANTGYVNCPNAQTLELNGVAVTPNTSAAKPVEGELNRIRVSFTGII